MTDAERIAAELISHEREWLTGWQGPGGAAYNAVAGFLKGKGLLNADWSLTDKGRAVRAVIEGEG